MELTGQQTLSLPIEQVWGALNDPAILQQCIPGCDTFTQVDDYQYDIAMTATVGPIKAHFQGKLDLTDIHPPNSYQLRFHGSGGAAGAGKGTAHVQLSEATEGTLLRYTVQAAVSGKLAQVGSRLIDGVAKRMADQFFERFKSVLEPVLEPDVNEDIQAPTPAIEATSTPPATHPASGSKTSRQWAITAVVVIVVALGLYAALG